MGPIEPKGKSGVSVRVKPTRNTRRMTLRVSQLDGRVTLTVPRGSSLRSVQKFVDSHSDWIETAQKRVPDAVAIAPGARIPFEGRLLDIVAGSGRAAKIMNDHIVVPATSPGRALAARLKLMAREILQRDCRHFANELGRDLGRITLRDTRSRWGSCSAKGDLMFSWRLIMAPPEVLTYVAAHECAHLVEMNHSSAFWGLVEDLAPNHEPHKAWLKTNGAGLHAYRFD